MSYLKIRADHIFTGTELLDKSYMLIVDGNGEVEEIIREETGGDYYPGIICPGFINCHCHLELSHLRGLIPESTGLVDFVFKVVNERHLDETIIKDAIKAAEIEMIQCGTVAVGDICNNLSTLTQKNNENLFYYNFIEASGWKPEVAQMRFERARDLYDHFERSIVESKRGKMKTSIVPHAPYSVSEELWEFILPFFENRTVTIHNQETAFEDEFFQDGSGDLMRMYEMMNIQTDFVPKSKSSLQHYYQKLSKAASIILVHNTFINQEDVDFIKMNKEARDKTFFCICTNANLYIENALPPLPMLLKNNCQMVLGTDSLASNHQLSIPEEMKSIKKNFPEINTTELLKWATFNGAKALQLTDQLGSFEKGKNPGVVWINNVENGNITQASTAKKII
ncbi:amidohydrolase family protein [soil metagenome]